jgi:hypothetical protein
MKRFLLLFLFALPVFGTVYTPPNLTDWTPGTVVGVTGGIPTNRNTLIDITQSPYNADNTGTNDCTSAISSAIDAAAAFNDGHVVYLPAGTYKMTGGIYKYNLNNFTIRGAGDTTVINAYGGSNTFLLGWSTDFDYDGGIAITSGFTAGSTVLTLASVTGLTVGQQLQIDELNDNTLPVVSFIYYGTRSLHARQQTVRITNVNSGASQVTISRGLLWTLQSGLSPKAHPMAYNMVATGIGIEDLKINALNSTGTFSIWLNDCTNSWVKNVHITGSYNYAIYLEECSNMEVRHCYLEQLNHSGPNGCLLLVERTADSLIEDNIFYQAGFHLMVDYGCTGNVFAYNFGEDTTIVTTVGIGIDSNHGAHNSYNLYEGNISPKFECDGYYGGASEDTVFRNWFHGTSPGADNQHPMILKRFTRNYNVVGNILGRSGQSYGSIYNIGYPNIGNDGYTGTASLINSAPWADWAAYVAGTYTGGTGGFQEIDLDVAATITIKGNYNYKDATIPASETLSGQTLAASLFRSSKPTYFGNLTWPPFDAANPGTPAWTQIPAGYRYTNGVDPPADSTTPARTRRGAGTIFSP